MRIKEGIKMQNKPNILFILSDQHNSKIMGCAGNEIIKTPNMDKLAEQGVMFNNAYCQNPLCVPSRSSLITGKYSKTLGIYDNRHIMETNQMTLPKILSENGYHTCCIGKTHFNEIGRAHV